VAEELLWVNRISRIYFQDRYVDYPLRLGNVLAHVGPATSTRAVGDYLKTQATSRLLGKPIIFAPRAMLYHHLSSTGGGALASGPAGAPHGRGTASFGTRGLDRTNAPPRGRALAQGTGRWYAPATHPRSSTTRRWSATMWR
jgi:hypothetical protein